MQIAITNRGNNAIQPEIIKQMQAAQRSIWVAVAWFTDREIYNVLLRKAQQGLKIRLIALYDDINQEKGVDFDNLSRNGVEVYLTKDGNLLMHHKFCIIDSETVIMGSYNYTVAAQSQRESVIVSKYQTQIVNEFEAEFNDILKEYFNKTSNDCPLTMEWWNGLLKYGNLKQKGLEQCNWQDIFCVHLAFEEKNIKLTGDLCWSYLDTHQSLKNCFDMYRLKFGNTNLPKVTQEKLNTIYQIDSLWLYKCQVDSLMPLRELKNLQELCFSNNQITDLEPLRQLKNLQKLEFMSNQITNLEPLRELKKLAIFKL